MNFFDPKETVDFSENPMLLNAEFMNQLKEYHERQVEAAEHLISETQKNRGIILALRGDTFRARHALEANGWIWDPRTSEYLKPVRRVLKCEELGFLMLSYGVPVTCNFVYEHVFLTEATG